MNKIEIETLVKQIIALQEDEDKIMERELLTRKMMRQLYKELGNAKCADYPTVYNHIGYANKVSGYTTYPLIKTEDELKYINNRQTDWHIKSCSDTKERIVESYTNDNWHCTVYAMNVCCDTYVKHKDYDNIYIRFISTRDCAKYEYVLVKE